MVSVLQIAPAPAARTVSRASSTKRAWVTATSTVAAPAERRARTAWVFSSLHTSVGMAFVGAVVGEYLGSAKGVGYLILQAEGTFDINSVFAGILVLTAFALLLDAAVTLIERRLLKWRPPAVAETL